MKNSKTKKMLFYPEGTRLNFKILKSKDDLKTKLKYGLLKSIFEDKDNLPVQLCISSNKENVFSLKKFSSKYGLTVNTEFSNIIYPKDFDCFEDFIEEIAKIWFIIWKNTHCKKN